MPALITYSRPRQHASDRRGVEGTEGTEKTDRVAPLASTQVTDKGVEELKQMKNLFLIYLQRTKVTPEWSDGTSQGPASIDHGSPLTTRQLTGAWPRTTKPAKRRGLDSLRPGDDFNALPGGPTRKRWWRCIAAFQMVVPLLRPTPAAVFLSSCGLWRWPLLTAYRGCRWVWLTLGSRQGEERGRHELRLADSDTSMGCRPDASCASPPEHLMSVARGSLLLAREPLAGSDL